MVAFSLGLSADGKRIAYKSVDARTMGDVAVMDVDSRRVTKLTDVNPEIKDFALGTLKPVSWKSFDGMDIWGLLLTPSDGSGRSTSAVARVRPRRTGRRFHLRPLSAVHAHRVAGRSVSDHDVREPGIRGPVPDAARGRRLRRGRPARDRERVGRRGLQRHHERRRQADRERRRRSRSPWRDGRLVRRLHDQLDRDADRPVQGRIGRRQPERPRRR